MTAATVGPVIQSGEVARAVVASVEGDNAGRAVNVVDRGSYVRIEVERECVITRASVERELGRPFKLHELEVNMPSFAGRIDTSTEMIRFYLGERHD